MRALLFSVAVFLFIPAICSAQAQPHNPLLARITYNGESSRICFAVYQNGEFYRLSKDGLTLLKPNAQDDPPILQGKLPEGQLNQLKSLLENIDFKPQAWGGMVLNGADWFAAEVVRDHKTKHYRWTNADDTNPFPKSVSDLIRWLQDFKAQNARLISSRELSSIRVCPSMNVRPVQPVIAGVKSGSDPSSCGAR